MMWLFLSMIACLAAQETPTFGTTVVSSSGFRGQIYHLKPETEFLPNLEKLKPVGAIYATELNVQPQTFQQGFPGVTDRFEWFAILYAARIWIEHEGRYAFTLLSDDGAKLRVDRKLLIDNDGIHQPSKLEASAVLTRGVHELQISYFQGPRYYVALELGIVPPGQAWRVLRTNEFLVPEGVTDLKPGKIEKIKSASNLPEAGPTIRRFP